MMINQLILKALVPFQNKLGVGETESDSARKIGNTIGIILLLIAVIAVIALVSGGLTTTGAKFTQAFTKLMAFINSITP